MTILPQTSTIQSILQRLRRGRTLIVIAVALVSLLAATVAIGQVSQNYDLACRGMLVAGGTVSAIGNYAVIGAMGSPIIPPADSTTPPTYAVRSANYAMRAGFLPAYPTGGTAADSATLQQNAPDGSDQAASLRLPRVFSVGRIIRGTCN
jgi:hypothetical protein